MKIFIISCKRRIFTDIHIFQWVSNFRISDAFCHQVFQKIPKTISKFLEILRKLLFFDAWYDVFGPAGTCSETRHLPNLVKMQTEFWNVERCKMCMQFFLQIVQNRKMGLSECAIYWMQEQFAVLRPYMLSALVIFWFILLWKLSPMAFGVVGMTCLNFVGVCALLIFRFYDNLGIGF